MSLRDQAAADGRAIIEQDGDTVTLTSPDTVPVVYTVPAILHVSGLSMTPEGLPIVGDHRGATVSGIDLKAKGMTDPATLRAKGWTASATDVLGRTISGTVYDVLIDDLGDVSFTIRKDS